MTQLATTVNIVASNPFFEVYSTPHQTIPFDKIKLEHYFPAFEKGISEHSKEVDAIVNNPSTPTFRNTIEALDKSGKLLSMVSSPFYNLLESETSDKMQELAQKVTPLLTEHGNSIILNEKLFARIKSVYNKRSKLKLTREQELLLQKTYDRFADNGANLSETNKNKYRELTKELSSLTLQFGQNSLKETNDYKYLITDRSMLKGLPDDVIEMLHFNAKKDGKEGWMLNLKATTYIPFMKYADDRNLRQKLYMAYGTRAMHGGETDNREIVRKIANDRLQLANLLGYKTYAEKVLKHTMAENTKNVYDLLDKLLVAYKPAAQKEVTDLQEFAKKYGANFQLMPWDWSFYAEKLKEEKYAINDEQIKPYFELNNTIKGVFGLATKLYGITFIKNPDIPVYNSEVEAFEVFDKEGKFLSVLYTDFHPRDSKRSGAWMNDFKPQWKEDKIDSRPHITIVMNFTRSTSTKPALLTFDELTTFLHEFGHALHGMLTKCTYQSLSGTNVYHDFVELPSQIMENWASQKEFLDGFAVHYQTGEKIPTELVEKIKAAENFNCAYLCLRQLSFGYLDMSFHDIRTAIEGDIVINEKQAMNSTQLLPVVNEVAMSPTFSHLFNGGYAAGYYGYKWAEVLDADAFSVFLKNGIFDPKTATSFKENILEKGGSELPMTLYKRFREQEPTIDALLNRNGITH